MTNEQEIFNIASTPEERFMYNFTTFDDLDPRLVKLDTNYVHCDGTWNLVDGVSFEKNNNNIASG